MTSSNPATPLHRVAPAAGFASMPLPADESLYREVLQRMPAAAYTTDADGRITFYNEAAAQLWGRRPLISRELWCGSHRLYQPSGRDLPHDKCPLAQALRQRQPILRAEIIVERPDGVRRLVLAHPQPVHDAEGRLLGAINVLVDVTELKTVQDELARATEQLADEVRTLTWLHELAMRVAGMTELAPALQAVLEAIVRIARADSGMLWLYDRDRGRLQPAASVGFDAEAVQRFAALVPAAGGGASGHAFATRQRVVVEDAIEDMRFAELREVAARAGIRAVYSTPMFNRDGEALGALSVHFRAPHRPSRSELQFADLCARHGAEVVESLRARDAVRQADKRKDEFLATLAHELRNPLAPISNALQVLKRTTDPAHLEHTRGIMERQLQHMVRLIDDLLDMSRISLGKMELRPERLDLRVVLARAVEASQPLLAHAGHDLTVSMPDEPVLVHGDATRLAQVFANLLDNAARYTPRRGRVTLELRAQGGEAVAAVRDNGVGIPAHMLDTVFQMFVQGDRMVEGSQGGLGVGLTLVKQLVEMHGGCVKASSEPGRGTDMLVRLPRLEEPASAHAPSSATAAAANDRLRVMIVDDNKDAAETMAMLLEILGHHILVAHDGVQAIEKARDFVPQAVLLDIGMPQLDGYEVCRRLREHGATRDALMIAVTGWGQEGDMLRSREAGFDAHLVKPVEPQALQGVLARLRPEGTG